MDGEEFVTLQVDPVEKRFPLEEEDPSVEAVYKRIIDEQNIQEESKLFLAKLLMVCGVAMMMLSIILFAVEDDGMSIRSAEKLFLSFVGILVTVCGFRITWPNNDMNPFQEFAMLWKDRISRKQFENKGDLLGSLVEQHVFKRFDELVESIKQKQDSKNIE
jgi:hypothetical protein